MAEADVVVWYNPRCSKCRGAERLLAAHGVPAQRVFYLDTPPARAGLRSFSCRCWKPAATGPAMIPRT